MVHGGGLRQPQKRTKAPANAKRWGERRIRGETPLSLAYRRPIALRGYSRALHGSRYFGQENQMAAGRVVQLARPVVTQSAPGTRGCTADPAAPSGREPKAGNELRVRGAWNLSPVPGSAGLKALAVTTPGPFERWVPAVAATR